MIQEADLGKNKNPYHGVFVVVFILLAIPALLYLAIKVLLENCTTNSAYLIQVQSQVFSGLISSIFCISVFLTGGMTEAFQIVCKRISEFIDSLIYENAHNAFRWYFQNIKEKGIVFWIYLAVILLNVSFFVNGLQKFLALDLFN